MSRQIRHQPKGPSAQWLLPQLGQVPTMIMVVPSQGMAHAQGHVVVTTSGFSPAKSIASLLGNTNHPGDRQPWFTLEDPTGATGYPPSQASVKHSLKPCGGSFNEMAVEGWTSHSPPAALQCQGPVLPKGSYTPRPSQVAEDRAGD